MLLPLIVAVASVALGAALAIWPASTRALGPIRTFALTASLAVVLTHLLPDAVQALGFWALPLFAVGLALPPGAKLIARLLWRPSAELRVGLEITYAGLLVHSLGDGVALGTYGGALRGGDEHADVLIALAAHTIPVTAVLVLAYGSTLGRRAALGRALGLAVATVAGVLASGLVTAGATESFSAVVAGVVAGLLLHVVVHDPEMDPPTDPRSRLVDIAAAAAGIALSVIGQGEHAHHEHADAHAVENTGFGTHLLELVSQVSPALLAGAAAALAASAIARMAKRSWMGTFLLRAPGDPVAAATDLHQRGAPPEWVLGFVSAGPQLGVEALLATAVLLGWQFGLVRAVAALATLVVVALLARSVARQPSAPPTPAPNTAHAPASLASDFGALVHAHGPWLVLGFVIAAFLRANLQHVPETVAGSAPLAALVTIGVALPIYISSLGALPIAAVLLAKGMSPSLLMAALLLGTGPHIGAAIHGSKNYGRAATALMLAAAAAASWMAAQLTRGWLIARLPSHVGEPASILAAAVLGLLFAGAAFHRGVRRWLADALLAGLRPPRHE